MYYYLLYFFNKNNGVKDCIRTHKTSKKYLNKLIKLLEKENIIVLHQVGFLNVLEAQHYENNCDFDYDSAIKERGI